MISYPQQRASPILEKGREGSHRGPAEEVWAKGGGGPAELEPLPSPSSSWVRTEMRSRSKMKACSGKRGEAGDDPERVSEHSPQ